MKPIPKAIMFLLLSGVLALWIYNFVVDHKQTQCAQICADAGYNTPDFGKSGYFTYECRCK